MSQALGAAINLHPHMALIGLLSVMFLLGIAHIAWAFGRTGFVLGLSVNLMRRRSRSQWEGTMRRMTVLPKKSSTL